MACIVSWTVRIRLGFNHTGLAYRGVWLVCRESHETTIQRFRKVRGVGTWVAVQRVTG